MLPRTIDDLTSSSHEGRNIGSGDCTSLALLASSGRLHGGMQQHSRPATQTEILSLRQLPATMMRISDAICPYMSNSSKRYHLGD